MRLNIKTLIGIAATLGLVGAVTAAPAQSGAGAPADGASPAQVQQLVAEVQALRAEVKQLRSAQETPWLTERQTAEVKALVADALADAETRSSLVGSGVVAGRDTEFYIASEDQTFRLGFTGQVQARYVANFRERLLGAGATAGFDGHETGFQIRRMKLAFLGYIGNPKLEYKVQITADRDTGRADLDDTFISYTILEGLKVWGGRFQDRFARESIMSSRNTQTADRTAVANIFSGNDDYVEGVGVEWMPTAAPALKLAATFNDGLNSGSTGPKAAVTGFQNGPHDFQNGAADFAFSGRADVKLTKDTPWSDASDVEAWSTVPGFRAFVGAGFHYEQGKTGDKQVAARTTQTGPYDSFVQWTADTLLKYHGLGLMAAGYGWHFEDASGAAGAKGDLNLYAATVQAGYLFWSDRIEPFAHYEYIHPDQRLSATTNDLSILTFGGNYFFKKHAAKATLDVQWAPDNVNTFNTMGTNLAGVGLLTDEALKKNQIAVRLQFQLLF